MSTQLPDDECYDADGTRWILTDRVLVDRLLITKGKQRDAKGKTKWVEIRTPYSYVVSTKIRAPSAGTGAVQRAKTGKR